MKFEEAYEIEGIYNIIYVPDSVLGKKCEKRGKKGEKGGKRGILGEKCGKIRDLPPFWPQPTLKITDPRTSSGALAASFRRLCSGTTREVFQ
jgi:hypothetical protein